MSDFPAGHPTIRVDGTVRANTPVSSGLIRLDLELEAGCPEGAGFLPGQFAMLNMPGSGAFVFSRPFSILDWNDGVVSFLYRVVGRGTAALEDLKPGAAMNLLGPLGASFPTLADDQAAVLIGGGVGLPPVAAWLNRFGRPQDRGYFGARDGADAPWLELQNPSPEQWQVSVDSTADVPDDQTAFHGRVTELVAQDEALDDAYRRVIMTCGPIPMLRAAAQVAADRGWECYVSLEEHMGCGYGACKGCVVPVVGSGDEAFRNATCCQEGPVFKAEQILWERYGQNDFVTV